MLRRIGVLVSLAVFATMFAGVSTASAQTAGACVFTGLSGQLTPPIQPILGDVTALTPLDIETGDYDFATGGALGGAVCAGLFNGTLAVAPNATITSEGSYDNILCGTGFAHDLDGSHTNISGANLLGGPPMAIGAATGDPAGYEIPFVGGTGPLLIGPNGKAPLAGLTDSAPFTDDPARSSVHTDAHQPVVSDYTGVGAVNIIPDELNGAGNCVSTPVGEFLVTGFFVATG